jgi:hypothetical protein
MHRDLTWKSDKWRALLQQFSEQQNQDNWNAGLQYLYLQFLIVERVKQLPVGHFVISRTPQDPPTLF